MMLTIVEFGLLIGVALGLCVKALILFPAVGLALVGTATIGIAHGHPVRFLVLTVVVVGTALQIGYLIGIIIRFGVAASRPESRIRSGASIVRRIHPGLR